MKGDGMTPCPIFPQIFRPFIRLAATMCMCVYVCVCVCMPCPANVAKFLPRVLFVIILNLRTADSILQGFKLLKIEGVG
jgi:hypothetical protein